MCWSNLAIWLENVALLVDGFVGGCGMVTTARRNFPNQFIHYHRAGHGMVTGEESNRGYTALTHMKWARMSGSSGIPHRNHGLW